MKVNWLYLFAIAGFIGSAPAVLYGAWLLWSALFLGDETVLTEAILPTFSGIFGMIVSVSVYNESQEGKK